MCRLGTRDRRETVAHPEGESTPVFEIAALCIEEREQLACLMAGRCSESRSRCQIIMVDVGMFDLVSRKRVKEASV